MRKQMEGDQDQRRATGTSTGSSKQRAHLGNDADHAEKIAGRGRGKAQPERFAADPAPHSVPSERPGPTGERAAPSPPRRDVRPGALTEEEEVVVEAVARLEAEQGPVAIPTIARDAGLDEEVVGQAVVDLVRVHDVLVEQEDDPDGVGAGPTYSIKARAT